MAARKKNAAVAERRQLLRVRAASDAPHAGGCWGAARQGVYSCTDTRACKAKIQLDCERLVPLENEMIGLSRA